MKEHLAEIVLLLEEAEEFRPAVKKAIEILKSYGPELRELTDGLCDYGIDRRISSIKKLEGAGFSRDDAINITMDEWYAIARNARNQQDRKS